MNFGKTSAIAAGENATLIAGTEKAKKPSNQRRLKLVPPALIEPQGLML